MPERHPLQDIKTFPSLVKYLRDELDWPIDAESFEDLTFDYDADDLGLSAEVAAKIRDVKQLRPLTANQPWGIFFVSFEKKQLPVVALRKILGNLVVKKRTTSRGADRAVWNLHDLLFISAFGEDEDRQITLAHFSEGAGKRDIPTLKVLGWDEFDTGNKLQHVDRELHAKLRWPGDEKKVDAWREQWSGAFTLRHRHVIATAKDLALQLAELAKAICQRVKLVLAIESDRGPLRKLYAAFREALIHDLDEDDFADMFAQTITYGLFSTAVSGTVPEGMMGGGTYVDAERMVELVPVTNPFLKEMLSTFLTIGGRRGKLDFDELGIQDVVEVLNSDKTNLSAVLRDFGNRAPGEDPVIHFYEDFLTVYDKKRKVQRGVFYTPQPVVSFIVRGIHELLQSELGLAHGLADTTTWGGMIAKNLEIKVPPLTDDPGEVRTISPDEPFVQILDPATGTATFLVEVIDVIYRHLRDTWESKGASAVPQIRNREYKVRDFPGYWNAYVPAHLLPRLHGYELMMAPYAIAHMKIGLKLTETGYRFGTDERAHVYLTNALEHWVKQLPLIGFDALAHEAAAVNEVKRHRRFTVVIGNPPYSGESANKLESGERDVKATYQCIDGIALKEKGKKNWLLDDYVKFLRLSHKTILATGCGFIGHIINNAFQDNPTFRGLRRSLILDFSTVQILDLHGSGTRADSNEAARHDENVFDILQGVCVLILSRTAQRKEEISVTRGDLWGTRDQKYRLLSAASVLPLIQQRIQPKADQWYFISLDFTNESEWSSFYCLLDAFPINGNGLISAKDHFAYAFTPEDFERDLEVFLDTRLTDKQVADRLRIKDNSMWSLHDGRLRLRRERGKAISCQVAYRPFDFRYSLFHRDVIFNLRMPITKHIIEGKNLVLLTTRMTKGSEWRHCFVTRSVSDCALLSNKTSTNAFAFPLKQKATVEGLFPTHDGYDANLSPQFVARFARTLGIAHNLPAKDRRLTPEDIFFFAYAMFHSPGYRSRYAEFLKLDFPRLPLTGNLQLFRALRELGGELAAIHLLESSALDQPITEFIGRANEVSKVGYANDTVWIDAGGTNSKPKPGASGFRGVSEEVWDFCIGGYQVCEKWLKDRKGRALSDGDIAYYQKIVVAISETIRLMAEIELVIDEYGGWPKAFVTTPG